MIGFKLTDTNDIEVDSDGRIQLLSTVQEAVKQRLSIKLRTFQNEWFLDTTFGIPYRQGILGKGFTNAERDAYYISVINQDPDVNRIVYFKSTYNGISRLYDLQFEVNVDDEQLRVEVPSILPSEEVDYGTGTNTALQSSCNVQYLNWSNELHPIIHTDLPEGGQYTWIYP